MKYQLKVLTPTLVGDGNRLSPIDYMVWRDQVNVLNQHRIFKLLSKGPRLEGYLQQLQKGHPARFRLLGRLRAELCRPAHPLRRRLLYAVLQQRSGRKP